MISNDLHFKDSHTWKYLKLLCSFNNFPVTGEFMNCLVM